MPITQEPMRVLSITSNELMLELIRTALDREATYSFIDPEGLGDEMGK